MRRKQLAALLIAIMMIAAIPMEVMAETENLGGNMQEEQSNISTTAELNETQVVKYESGNKLCWEKVEDAESYNVYWVKDAEKIQLNETAISSQEEKIEFTLPERVTYGGESGTTEDFVGAKTIKVVAKFEERLSEIGSVNAWIVNPKAYVGESQTTLSWEESYSADNLYIDGEEIDDYSESNTYTLDNVVGKHTFYVTETFADKTYISETISYDVAPSKVTGFTSYSGYKCVTLKWNAVNGASGYIVYVNGKEKKRTTATKIDISVANDTNYKFSVSAYTKTASGDLISSPTVARTDGSVRTMYYKITFKAKAKLTSHSGGNVTVTFPKGYTTTAFEFYEGKYHFKYKGRIYYCKAIRTKNQKIAKWSGGSAYSIKEAENFINKRNLSSKTKYLIWTNLYTQHTYIFKGSKNKWTCIKHFACSTGKARTPTETGKTSIKKKIRTRHNLPYWNMCARYSIHGKHNSWPIGKGPKSGGCIRNYNENAKWIYKNMPVKTAVFTF